MVIGNILRNGIFLILYFENKSGKLCIKYIHSYYICVAMFYKHIFLLLASK